MVLIASCCTIKNQSSTCNCKRYFKFVEEHWIYDDKVKRTYIDSENSSIVLNSQEVIDEFFKCFEGKSVKQIKRVLPHPNEPNGTEYSVQTSKKVFDCRFKGIDCNAGYKSAVSYLIKIYAKEKVNKIETFVEPTHSGPIRHVKFY